MLDKLLVAMPAIVGVLYAITGLGYFWKREYGWSIVWILRFWIRVLFLRANSIHFKNHEHRFFRSADPIALLFPQLYCAVVTVLNYETQIELRRKIPTGT